MLKKQSGILALSVALAAASGAASAATQGTVGATSAGDLNIQVVVPSLIRITDLADIDLGTYTGDGLDMTGSSPACVRRNSAGNYGIVATSTNGSFALAGGVVAGTLPYSVSWGGSALTYNTSLGAQVADSGTLGACTPVAGKLSVTVTGASLDAAEPDTYTDTLILTVTPE